MRRSTTIVVAIFLALAIAGPVSAHGGRHGPGHGPGRGFVSPNAEVRGYSLKQLANAWNVWALGTPEADNPLVANRCEQSPIDKKIWFMPVSLGGDYEVDCEVPSGAYLVATPAGWFCDIAEAGGSTTAELRACARDGFALLTYAEVVLDGRSAKHLRRHVVTSRRIELPGPNLLTDGPTSIVDKGIYIVIKPLSRGSHTLRLYDEFASLDFTAGVTFNITVTKAHHRHRH